MLPFLDLPPHQHDPATAAVAILPVPYDGTSTWMKGADRGPAALLEASHQVELFDIESGCEPCAHGIATLDPVTGFETPELLADAVAARVDAIIDRRQLPVILGGEHSVTIGAAVAARVPGLGVLQIDAHADTREVYEGSTHNHACVMARVREWCSIVQVGIRSLDAAEWPRLDLDRVFLARDIAGRPDRSAWIDAVVERLPDDVYVTIDLDAFDPSVLPATGTPEPGGLSWYEVTDLLAAVARRRRVVGFDVVELLPQPGQHASAFTAARLVYRFIAALLAART